MANDLLIHREYLDGTLEHVPFSRAEWEEGSTVCRKHYSRFFAHVPSDCEAMVRDLARMKALNSGPVQGASGGVFAESVEPIVFPPASCTNPLTELQFLSERSGLCLADVREIMVPKVPFDRDQLDPMSDKRGQFLLF